MGATSHRAVHDPAVPAPADRPGQRGRRRSPRLVPVAGPDDRPEGGGLLRLDVVAHETRPLRVRCLGELDASNAGELARDLRRWIDGSCCVLLDLHGLDFVDAAGLSGLVGALDHARRSGRPLRLGRRYSRPVRRTLAASGLLVLFDETAAGPGCPRHPRPARA